MRAIAVHEFGGQPVLVDVPKPVPGPGGVLVRLAAAGVNPFDRKVADGMMDGSMRHVFPLVLGIDGAGVVEEVGEGVTRFAPGDEVFGTFFQEPAGIGTYAEYATVPETNPLALLPAGFDPVVAAALPTAGLTAVQLVEALEPRAGITLLLVGATGGVGQLVVQLAAAAGAQVVATGRPGDAEMLLSLGAAEVVDHTAGPLTSRVHGVDAVIDLVGDGPGFAANLPAVRLGGQALTTTFAADPAVLTSRGLRGGNFEVRGTAEALSRLAESVSDGRLNVPVEHRLPLAEAAAELVRPRSTGARGKTVLVV
ncbi:NADP-dependent oxidoreductase [Umezawaea tangerina]|uniref:NADPH:quinone reductase-like Zn-dependent oxidoreductase n=1 Tax=Umezawaea tangerina TaxID=84725 RepID=A0A2T0TJY5_9PSEU|nr:NADP-dependent oxidoreductase [Umezawaea tangerina]PRY45921.1 NADPH:quinone reductase-like Zn-dependent oxidoreductase [Umezawaea tangerina]